MAGSDQDFEDIGLNDDIDDLWDDVYDEDDELDIDPAIDLSVQEPLAPPSPKKKSLSKPLFIATLIGASIYAAYPFLFADKTQNQIPIIKLSEDTAVNTHADSLPENIQNTVIEQPSTGTLQEENMPVAKPRHPLEETSTILTPLPEDINAVTVPLSKLVDTEDTEIQDSTQNNHKDIPPALSPENLESASTSKSILSEKNLLLKTEAVFEQHTVHNHKDESKSDTLEENNSEHPLLEPTTDQREEIENASNPQKEPKEILPEINSKTSLEPEKVEKPDVVSAQPKKKKPTQKVQSKIIIKEPEATAPPKNNPVWVIRGAQSGSAVIFDKESKEMKSVEVNDFVTGIGRIKSIKTINGSWVIIGTQGKIEQ